MAVDSYSLIGTTWEPKESRDSITQPMGLILGLNQATLKKRGKEQGIFLVPTSTKLAQRGYSPFGVCCTLALYRELFLLLNFDQPMRIQISSDPLPTLFGNVDNWRY